MAYNVFHRTTYLIRAARDFFTVVCKSKGQS